MTNFIIHFFIGKHESADLAWIRNRYGIVGGTVGIFCNVSLFLLKLLAGFLANSVSVMADAFNNLSDAASSVVALLGFKLSNMPADKEHPFGHGRYEYVAGFVVSAVIIIVGFELLKTSLVKIINPEPIIFQMISVCIMAASILVKLWMNFFYRKMGKAISSATLMAAAADSLNDVAATSAIIVGMLIYRFAGYNLDGYIGIAVACFIFYSGITTARDTLSPLLGQGPDADFVKNISDETLSFDGIYGVHDIIVHSYGAAKILVSLHAEVSSRADIMSVHNTIDAIEKYLFDKYNCEAVIHMDPVDIDDEVTATLRKAAQEAVERVDSILTIHDFRMIHENGSATMAFDVAAPFKHTLSDEGLKEEICNELLKFSDNYKAVIHVDRTF